MRVSSAGFAHLSERGALAGVGSKASKKGGKLSACTTLVVKHELPIQVPHPNRQSEIKRAKFAVLRSINLAIYQARSAPLAFINPFV